ncbi:hypothetical protein [Microvirga flavescens]|uniref:hypothetical protein n=1 Tax=Microvirga flavescens TaxID=2249811 RepID=UPI0013002129|nr:hypothetical protein [Microvirga flavescens]
MLPQTFMAIVLAGNAILSGVVPALPARVQGESTGTAEARYEAGARQVSNWREEAVEGLKPGPVIVLATLLGVERPLVTRCVKLNNYWCIKSARWEGEIGKDGEGHVGFVSAERGADAAATLLRRYYLEFNRKSALDIVRRWAPPECGTITGIGGMVLAVKGIGGTLRARWLAAHRVKLTAGGTGKGARTGRVSIVIPRTGPIYRVPDIAEGMGEHPKPKPAARTAAQRLPEKSRQAGTSAKVASTSSCAPDEARLKNYAQQMVDGLGIGPNDDLKLFSAEGLPQPNLKSVMLAMSAFELGMLRAHPDLVEGAVQRAAARALPVRDAEARLDGR